MPAVPADTEWNSGYPGGNFGEEAWGCRAVSHARNHERIVTTSTTSWLEAHPYLFYFGIEDFVYHRTRNVDAWQQTPDERARVVDQAAPGRAAPTAITYRFDTAYRPPDRFLDKLAQRYPHLYLSLAWQGEEPSMHGMSVKAPHPQGWPINTRAAMPPGAVLDAALAESARRTPPPYAASRHSREPAGIENTSAA